MSVIYNYVSFTSVLFLCFHLRAFSSPLQHDSKLISLNSTQPVTSELNITNYGITNSTEFNANDTSEEDDLINILDAPLPTNFSDRNRYYTYYNSKILTKPTEAMKYWVDIDKMPNVALQPMLSESHRPAESVNLTFEFPFYGHPIKNIRISTGGFLFLGNTVRSWLASSQYIAPFMANFDTRLNETSKIKYAKNSTVFVVQWENVATKELPQIFFIFQVSLFPNGDIVFVYKDLPISFNDLPSTHHPVKVGLSDAYLIDRFAFFIRQDTIFDYNRVALKKEKILNNTAIYFTALPTCITLKDFESCSVGVPGLDCRWCEGTGRCFDGLDRQRQDWLAKNCYTEAKKNNCLVSTNSSTVIRNATSTFSPYPGNLNRMVQLGI
ncbi:plexin domain-containing protein 2-like [Tetranychus urticae]|uniref:PSI domain-containing protein n=1 Tax=Tetranychus urticae TaxID=32264 RepID=T1L0L5_TETUR|nr:plexin domain-containing protein 2-like [Tetranychus urticae]